MSRAVAVPALVVPFPYDDAPAHATTGRAYGVVISSSACSSSHLRSAASAIVFNAF